MIQGVVNASHEVVVTISLQGHDGQVQDISHDLNIEVVNGGRVVIQARGYRADPESRCVVMAVWL